VISQLKSKGTKPNGATTVQQPSRPISEVVTKKAKFMMEDEIDEAIGKIIKLDKNAALYREILQYNVLVSFPSSLTLLSSYLFSSSPSKSAPCRSASRRRA